MFVETQLIVKLYSKFYKEYFNLSENYSFKPKESNLKDIERFKDSKYFRYQGKDLLFRYLTFQFSYYSELELTNNYGNISTRYIFGKSSIERWVNRNQDFDYLLEDSKVSRNFLENLISIEVEIDDDYEILKKKQFFNTDFGFSYCIENTSLYSEIHLCCTLCKFKLNCKELVDNYKLYDKVKK